MKSIDTVIDNFPSSPQERGKVFEDLVLNLMGREFANVKSAWLWEDNPFDSRRDTGIDIVVQTHNEELWAVQCKAYSNSVSKRDLDSFYADSSHPMYSRKMVFATTDSFSKNAVEKANDLGVELYGKSWFVGRDCSLTTEVPAPREPRPHQVEAVSSIIEGFRKSNSVTATLACGTGKTFIANRVVGDDTFIFVAPALTLLDQAHREFVRENPARAGRCVIVCSDKSVGGHDAPTVSSVEDLSQYKGYNVFVTYHSLATVRDAGLKFDVMIIDEAHKTVTENLGKEIWDFDCRKLFLTATPKVVTDNLKEDFGLVSMDDEEYYGKHVFDLPMREAIDRGLLAPYELNIFLADSEQTVRFIEDRRYVDNNGKLMNAEDAAVFIAIEKLVADGATSGIVYLRTNKKCEDAASIARGMGINALSIKGSMSQNERRAILNQLKSGAVVFADKVLSEGVDVPTLDFVLFGTPKKSLVDIVQSIGRVLRIDPNNPDKVGKVVLPVALAAGYDPDEVLEASNFRHINKTLQQLAESDSSIKAWVEAIQRGDGVDTISDRSPVNVIGSAKIADQTLSSLKDKVCLYAVQTDYDRLWWNRLKSTRDYIGINGELPPHHSEEGMWLRTQRSLITGTNSNGSLMTEVRRATLDAEWWFDKDAFESKRRINMQNFKQFILENKTLPPRGSYLYGWFHNAKSNLPKSFLNFISDNVGYNISESLSDRRLRENLEIVLQLYRRTGRHHDGPRSQTQYFLSNLRQKYRQGDLSERQVGIVEEVLPEWNWQGPMNPPKVVCSKGHPLVGENLAIKPRQRVCVICRRSIARRSRHGWSEERIKEQESIDLKEMGLL